jgi:uncharacterized phiE125 gp8 family phage protein
MTQYKTPKPWGSKVTTEPATEPVVAADLRTQLQMDDATQDTYLSSLAKVARKMVEKHILRKTTTQTVTITCDDFPAGNWELPFPPVIAVTEIAYRDTSGASQTVSVPSLRNADQPNMNAVLEEPAGGWPGVDDEPGAVTLTMTAGYGTASSHVPAETVLAIKMIAANLYEYRHATTTDKPEQMPHHIESLLIDQRWYP